MSDVKEIEEERVPLNRARYKDNVDILASLYTAFVDRSEALYFRGKRREDAVMNYLVGAAKIVQILEEGGFVTTEHLQKYLERQIVLLVASRGYSELEQFLKKYAESQQSSTQPT